jgi:hypothetical protein
MTKMRMFGVAGSVLVLSLLGAIVASASVASSAKSLLELKLEGKQLNPSAEVLLVAGYSLGGCYWEEQEFKVVVNRARTDKLVRTGQSGQFEDCDGGAESIELTSADKMIVKLAPMRIHIEGPCVYEVKEISATFSQEEWGPEIFGSAVGRLNSAESGRSSTCAKTGSTLFDMALSGMETRLFS